ncbi:MAG: RNA polymerase sigma factor [Cryomorphaceae bacterium]
MAISAKTIIACKKGSRKAIKAFYEESSGWMLGIALRYIPDRNEAMSVVNMSLLAALDGLKKFDESRPEHIEGWLKKILVRKAIDYLRKEKMSTEEISETAKKVANLGESNRRKEELMGMVNSLPTKTRAVFNLFAIEGYKHREIAELLGISDGTSKWHLNEARKLLRVKLEQLDKIIPAK